MFPMFVDNQLPPPGGEREWVRGMAKDLVKIIRDNPDCVAEIDNDCWTLRKNAKQPKGFENWTYEKQDEWHKAQELASSDEKLEPLGDGGYGSGNCYGGDILQALAKIVGIKVQSV